MTWNISELETAACLSLSSWHTLAAVFSERRRSSWVAPTAGKVASLMVQAMVVLRPSTQSELKTMNRAGESGERHGSLTAISSDSP